MYTNNYDFKNINALKIILKNKEGKVLLIQEPETNDWMPLHWGLPGGKPTETESLLETFERKSKTDIGQNIILEGVICAYEILMKGRTVIMYIVVASAESNEIVGEAKQYKWVGKEDIEEMDRNEMTEFYNKELLLDFFNGKYKLLPIDFIKTLEFYKMENDEEYTSWFNSGKK